MQNKIDEIRIKAWYIKVTMGTSIANVPEKYRAEVAARLQTNY